jgi:hypothetical protein
MPMPTDVKIAYFRDRKIGDRVRHTHKVHGPDYLSRMKVINNNNPPILRKV